MVASDCFFLLVVSKFGRFFARKFGAHKKEVCLNRWFQYEIAEDLYWSPI